MTELMSIGAIAKHFKVDLHRAEYAARTRRVVPAMRVAHANLYDAGGIRQIGNALVEIGGKRKQTEDSK